VTETPIREVFSQELQSLIEVLKTCDKNRLLSDVPQIACCRKQAVLDTILSEKPPSQQDYGFYHEWPQSKFHFSEKFLSDWRNYFEYKTESVNLRNGGDGEKAGADKVTAEDMRVAIQMFYLHEFVHVEQSLTSYRHNDIEKAPTALRLVDYQADAIPVLAMFSVYNGNPEKLNRFGRKLTPVQLLARLVRAQLWGIESFQFSRKRKPKELGIGQFYRYLTWHFQLHRVRAYNPKGDLKNIRLEVLPTIDVRGLRQWELKDRTTVGVEPAPYQKMKGYDPPFLWVGAVDETGLAKVHRLWPTDPDRKIPAMYQGILKADTGLTHGLFMELFDQNQCLIGYQQTANGEKGSVSSRAEYVRDSGADDELTTLTGAVEILKLLHIVPLSPEARRSFLALIGVNWEPDYLMHGTDLFTSAMLRHVKDLDKPAGKKYLIDLVKERGDDTSAAVISAFLG
jgi:hypothetical protein